MKNITIAGNIGKDAATQDAGDTTVTRFSVAVSERVGTEKRTIWFDCAMWGSRGEKVAQYLRKGVKVTVSGDLSTREYEGKTYLTVRVGDLTLQGDGAQVGNDDRQPARLEQPKKNRDISIDLDDEIPF